LLAWVCKKDLLSLFFLFFFRRFYEHVSTLRDWNVRQLWCFSTVILLDSYNNTYFSYTHTSSLSSLSLYLTLTLSLSYSPSHYHTLSITFLSFSLPIFFSVSLTFTHLPLSPSLSISLLPLKSIYLFFYSISFFSFAFFPRTLFRQMPCDKSAFDSFKFILSLSLLFSSPIQLIPLFLLLRLICFLNRLSLFLSLDLFFFYFFSSIHSVSSLSFSIFISSSFVHQCLCLCAPLCLPLSLSFSLFLSLSSSYISMSMCLFNSSPRFAFLYLPLFTHLHFTLLYRRPSLFVGLAFAVLTIRGLKNRE